MLDESLCIVYRIAGDVLNDDYIVYLLLIT